MGRREAAKQHLEDVERIVEEHETEKQVLQQQLLLGARGGAESPQLVFVLHPCHVADSEAE